MAHGSSQSKRSPAFQWYPEAYFSSSRVQRMSHTERGIYIDLLSYCWLENGLPTSTDLLAGMLRISPKRFARIWSNGPLHECFHERNGRLFNARQERERKKQREFREQKSAAARSGWSRRNADAMHVHSKDDAACTPSAMPSVCISVSDRISTSGSTEDSAEPHGDSSPVVLTFPVVGNPKHPTWSLRQSLIDRLVTAYPNLNVPAECQRAAVWCETNPSKRKTAKGMPAFMSNWMSNATNRNGGARPSFAATGTTGRGRTGAPPPGKYDGIEES